MDQHFAVLGLPRAASLTDLRQAYKAKVLEHHPDRPTGDAELFKQVHKSYSVLLKRFETTGSHTLINSDYTPSNRSRAVDPRAVPAQHRPRPAPFGPAAATSAAAGRSSTPKAGARLPRIPKPLPSQRTPIKALFVDGKTIITFDGHRDTIKCNGLQHGDCIRLRTGEEGTIVGLAGDQDLYWYRKGELYASFCAHVGAGYPALQFMVLKQNASTRKGFFEAATSTASSPASHVDPSPLSGVGKSVSASKAAGTGCSGVTPATTSSPPITIDSIIAQEAEVRRRFLTMVDLYLHQTSWHARLPLYAPRDRLYNTHGSPMYSTPK